VDRHIKVQSDSTTKSLMLFTVICKDFPLLFLCLFSLSLSVTHAHTISHYVHSLPGTTVNNGTMQQFCGRGFTPQTERCDERGETVNIQLLSPELQLEDKGGTKLL